MYSWEQFLNDRFVNPLAWISLLINGLRRLNIPFSKKVIVLRNFRISFKWKEILQKILSGSFYLFILKEYNLADISETLKLIPIHIMNISQGCKEQTLTSLSSKHQYIRFAQNLSQNSVNISSQVIPENCEKYRFFESLNFPMSNISEMILANNIFIKFSNVYHRNFC